MVSTAKRQLHRSEPTKALPMAESWHKCETMWPEMEIELQSSLTERLKDACRRLGHCNIQVQQVIRFGNLQEPGDIVAQPCGENVLNELQSGVPAEQVRKVLLEE